MYIAGHGFRGTGSTLEESPWGFGSSDDGQLFRPTELKESRTAAEIRHNDGVIFC